MLFLNIAVQNLFQFEAMNSFKYAIVLQFILIPLMDTATITETSIPQVAKVGDYFWTNCSYTLDENEEFLRLDWLKDGYLIYSFYSSDYFDFVSMVKNRIVAELLENHIKWTVSILLDSCIL